MKAKSFEEIAQKVHQEFNLPLPMSRAEALSQMELIIAVENGIVTIEAHKFALETDRLYFEQYPTATEYIRPIIEGECPATDCAVIQVTQISPGNRIRSAGNMVDPETGEIDAPQVFVAH